MQHGCRSTCKQAVLQARSALRRPSGLPGSCRRGVSAPPGPGTLMGTCPALQRRRSRRLKAAAATMAAAAAAAMAAAAAAAKMAAAAKPGWRWTCLQTWQQQASQPPSPWRALEEPAAARDGSRKRGSGRWRCRACWSWTLRAAAGAAVPMASAAPPYARWASCCRQTCWANRDGRHVHCSVVADQTVTTAPMQLQCSARALQTLLAESVNS